MKKKLLVPLLVAALTLVSLPAYADFAKWADPTHSFKKDQTIYTAVVNTDALSKQMASNAHSFQVIFNQKAAAIKNPKIITAPLPGTLAILPGSEASVPQEETVKDSTAVHIPQAAVDAGADLYVVPKVTRCQKQVSVVPAHTEWQEKEIHETVHDSKGYRDVVHRIPIPVKVPEKQYVTMYLTVRFDVYSMKTGALVYTSEDARDRQEDSDFNGMYTRIVDRFFGTFKSQLGK